jgi:hypothetical protein
MGKEPDGMCISYFALTSHKTCINFTRSRSKSSPSLGGDARKSFRSSIVGRPNARGCLRPDAEYCRRAQEENELLRAELSAVWNALRRVECGTSEGSFLTSPGC